MNILIGTHMFTGYTGSEWYNYELCRGLATMRTDKNKRTNKVFLFSQTHPESSLAGRLRKCGVELINYAQPHKLPDNIDVVHYAHTTVGSHLLAQPQLRKAKFFTTIHSEIIDLEHPILDDRIQSYISIRPPIREMLQTRFGLAPERITDIYNPIDETVFNTDNTHDEGYILFHGALNDIRLNAAQHCVQFAKDYGLRVVFVGLNLYPHVFNTTNMPHCTFNQSQVNIIEFVKNCTMTAGILLGRSTIEGYFCGKPGIIYDVDQQGTILNVSQTFEQADELDKYIAKNVVNKIFGIYQ